MRGERLDDAVLDYVREHQGATGWEILQNVDGSDADIEAAMARLERAKLMISRTRSEVLEAVVAQSGRSAEPWRL